MKNSNLSKRSTYLITHSQSFQPFKCASHFMYNLFLFLEWFQSFSCLRSQVLSRSQSFYWSAGFSWSKFRNVFSIFCVLFGWRSQFNNIGLLFCRPWRHGFKRWEKKIFTMSAIFYNKNNLIFVTLFLATGVYQMTPKFFFFITNGSSNEFIKVTSIRLALCVQFWCIEQFVSECMCLSKRIGTYAQFLPYILCIIVNLNP